MKQHNYFKQISINEAIVSLQKAHENVEIRSRMIGVCVEGSDNPNFAHLCI